MRFLPLAAQLIHRLRQIVFPCPDHSDGCEHGGTRYTRSCIDTYPTMGSGERGFNLPVLYMQKRSRPVGWTVHG